MGTAVGLVRVVDGALVSAVVNGSAGDEGVKVEVTQGIVDAEICAEVVMGGSNLDGESREIVAGGVGVATETCVVGLIGRKTLRTIINRVSKSLLSTSLPAMLYCAVTVTVTGPAG